jgi:hypothetical protein
MKIEVGTQLRWQGRPVVCTRICTNSEQRLAPQHSAEWRTELATYSNVKILAQHFDDFSEGEQIRVEWQVLELVEIGRNIFFLYPYFNVRKESSNGPKGIETSDRQAPSSEAATDWQRNQGGQGDGE